MRKWWSLLDRLERAVVISGAALVLLLILGISECAYALELNAARPVKQEGLAGATPELVYYADGDSTNVFALPSAYLIWEKVGNPIEIRRFYANVAETEWIAIPDGQSFLVPAPPAFKRTGSTAWWHKMAFKGAASDTIKYLPMDR